MTRANGRSACWILSLSTVVALLIFPSSSSAHEVYDDGYFWESLEGKCLKARKVEISHGSTGYGYTKVDALAQKETYDPTLGTTVSCATAWERPLGTLANHTVFWKWHKPTQQWAICRELDWRYSPTASAENIQKKSWTAVDFCSDGYYGTTGHGSIRLDGQWKTDAVNGVYSGYHWLWDD